MRVTPFLVQRLPLREVLIRSVDMAKGRLDSVAEGIVGSTGALAGGKTECALLGDLERIVTWCREGQLVLRGDRAIRKRLPGLLPSGLAGSVLACAIERFGGNPGRR